MGRHQNQPRANAVNKARAAAVAVQKGVFKTKTRKVRTKTAFHRPKTLRLDRTPQYPRKAIARRDDKFDDFRVIKHPLTSEAAMKKMEEDNTLTFLVDLKANKIQIAKAVQNLYKVKVSKVNTLVRPDGEKKAYVRLHAEEDALQKAGTIGII